MIDIVVAERGRRVLSSTEWTLLSADQAFQDLLKDGIVVVSFSRAGGGVRPVLEAGRYVGLAEGKGFRLKIIEKVSGSLLALWSHALGPEFRIVRANSGATSSDELLALLISEYVWGVRAYVSKGRRFSYGWRREVSPTVRGRIRVPETIRLRAGGRRHLVAYDVRHRHHDIPFHRVLLRALREVERLARVTAVPERELSVARGMSMLLSDARSPDVLFGGRSDWAERSRILARGELSHARKDLLELAAALLSRWGIGLAEDAQRQTSRAWFLSLEPVFERAVRRTIAALLPEEVHVRPGSGRRRYVFPQRTTEFRADPDVAIERWVPGAIVGDMKYKDRDNKPLQAEVYQLLAHSHAFGAQTAFLVFPGTRFFHKSFGVSAGGVRVDVFDLDVLNLEAGVEKMLEVLAVGARLHS